MSALLAIIFLGTFTLLFGSALLYVASILGPKPKYSSVKDSTYECGMTVQETGHSKVPIKFYLTAILFILFDIEIIFMYPWACLLYTSPSPRDATLSRMPSSA